MIRKKSSEAVLKFNRVKNKVISDFLRSNESKLKLKWCTCTNEYRINLERALKLKRVMNKAIKGLSFKRMKNEATKVFMCKYVKNDKVIHDFKV